MEPVQTGIETRPLNRDVIKYIAVVCMTFNHIANAGLIPYNSPLREIFVDIGYVTAVTMAFFLVEGFHYTRDRRKYAVRLLAFACIAQIPFMTAFHTDSGNMLLTLLLCYLILCVMAYVEHPVLRGLMTLALAFLTTFCDWPLTIAVATVLFARSRGNRRQQILAYVLVMLLDASTMYGRFAWRYAPAEAVLHTFYAVLPLGISAVLTLGLYNGKKFQTHTAFHRWFFYIYYPAHLAALCFIRYLLRG